MTPDDRDWYTHLAQVKELRKRKVARLEAENWRQRHPPGATYTLDCPPVGPPPQEDA